MPRALNLRSAGFDVVTQLAKPRPGDVLLIWNRYGGGHELAGEFERAGARVLVAENGWLGKGWRGGDWFSLCLGHHAGAGHWSHGGPARWGGWGVELAPYREGGDETIILGQRGIGEPGVCSPGLWAENTRHRLGAGRIRPHPGNGPAPVPLADDLARARDCVTWNSGAALHALLLGVPVWHGFAKWIGAQASRPLAEWGGAPQRDAAARLAMFQRLAWAMWTLDEISTGAPFAHVRG
jgi:hypothetical protein